MAFLKKHETTYILKTVFVKRLKDKLCLLQMKLHREAIT